MDLTRRDALKVAGLGAVGTMLVATGCAAQDGAVGSPAGLAVASTSKGSAGKRRYTLMPLPYPTDALEPVIDRETVQVHHDKHHAGYVKGANGILDKLDAARSGGDFSQIKPLSRALAFTGSGVVLHDLYWMSMSPKPMKAPSGSLAQQVQMDFGGLETCKSQLAAAAKAVEGSGWAVLAWEPVLGQLLVLQIENHQKLTIWGCVPLVVIDVWEHAYYKKYMNRRADYVDGWMGIMDWTSASRRFDQLKPGS